MMYCFLTLISLVYPASYSAQNEATSSSLNHFLFVYIGQQETLQLYLASNFHQFFCTVCMQSFQSLQNPVL